MVGCKFSEKIIYPSSFAGNPDAQDPVYSTEYGVYTPHCGLDNVILSWGHDEVRCVILPFPLLVPVPRDRDAVPELINMSIHRAHPSIHPSSICITYSRTKAPCLRLRCT